MNKRTCAVSKKSNRPDNYKNYCDCIKKISHNIGFNYLQNMFGKFPAKQCLCLKNVFSDESLTIVEVTALQFVVYFSGMIHFMEKRIYFYVQKEWPVFTPAIQSAIQSHRGLLPWRTNPANIFKMNLFMYIYKKNMPE
jgi:hypothetical protein